MPRKNYTCKRNKRSLQIRLGIEKKKKLISFESAASTVEADTSSLERPSTSDEVFNRLWEQPW